MTGATPRRGRAVTAGAVAAFVALGGTACGGGGDDHLSALAQEGKAIAADRGCQSCHRTDGKTGVGPSWLGLAGTTVELADGTTVVADDEYLRRSILDPDFEEVAGYAVKMPENALVTSDDADAIVAYINELR